MKCGGTGSQCTGGSYFLGVNNVSGLYHAHLSHSVSSIAHVLVKGCEKPWVLVINTKHTYHNLRGHLPCICDITKHQFTRSKSVDQYVKECCNSCTCSEVQRWIKVTVYQPWHQELTGVCCPVYA